MAVRNTNDAFIDVSEQGQKRMYLILGCNWKCAYDMLQDTTWFYKEDFGDKRFTLDEAYAAQKTLEELKR